MTLHDGFWILMMAFVTCEAGHLTFSVWREHRRREDTFRARIRNIGVAVATLLWFSIPVGYYGTMKTHLDLTINANSKSSAAEAKSDVCQQSKAMPNDGAPAHLQFDFLP